MKTTNLFAFVIVFVALAMPVFAVGDVFGYVKDGTLTGVNGALVNVTQGSVEINSTLTNASGFYNMTVNGTPNAFNITVIASGFDTSTNLDVPLLDGDNAMSDFILAASPTGNISGFVRDQNGAGVASVSVQARQGSSTIATVTSGADGNYTFSDLLSNSSGMLYNVSASKSGYHSNTTENVSVITNTTVAANVTLLEILPGNISGYVLNGCGNTAVENATVYVKQGNSTVATTTSNASGYWNVSVDAGDYNISASTTAFSSSVYNTTVAEAGNVQVNITLAQTATITGTVSSGSSTVSGATVSLSSSTFSSSTTTDSAGAFSFNAPVGSYNITVSKSGYYDLTFSHTHACAGSSTSASITAVPSTSSTGYSGSINVAPEDRSTYSWMTLVAGQTYEMPIVLSRLSLTGIKFKAETNITDAKISVQKIADYTGVVKPSGTAYEYIEITSNLGNSSKDIEVYFKVTSSWMSVNNFAKEDVKLVRYLKDFATWEVLPTTFVSNKTSTIEFKAITQGFSTFAIIGEKSQTQNQTVQNQTSVNITTPGNTTSNITGNGTLPITGNVVTGPLSPWFVAGILLAVCIVVGAAIFVKLADSGSSKFETVKKKRK